MEPDRRLRPIERRVLRLSQAGMDTDEIASRFRRSPDMIRRVVTLAAIPRPSRPAVRGDVLTPVERRILRWRAAGADYADIGPRFRRSPAFVQRVEDLARYKLGRGDN
jgi:DNA-binding CsgD family transcriptional regulator